MDIKSFHVLNFNKKEREGETGEGKRSVFEYLLVARFSLHCIRCITLFIFSLLRTFLVLDDPDNLGQLWSDMSQDVLQLGFVPWLDRRLRVTGRRPPARSRAHHVIKADILSAWHDCQHSPWSLGEVITSCMFSPLQSYLLASFQTMLFRRKMPHTVYIYGVGIYALLPWGQHIYMRYLELIHMGNLSIYLRLFIYWMFQFSTDLWIFI